MKKNKLISLILIFSVFLLSCDNSSSSIKENSENSVSDSEQTLTFPEYIAMSDERFAEIEKLNEEQDWCDPINIKGVERNELISFYIKSYKDETISTYMDWAYEKMFNFPESKPDSEQIKKFEQVMKLPRNKENTFKFMYLMTDIQLQTVGY